MITIRLARVTAGRARRQGRMRAHAGRVAHVRRAFITVILARRSGPDGEMLTYATDTEIERTLIIVDAVVVIVAGHAIGYRRVFAHAVHAGILRARVTIEALVVRDANTDVGHLVTVGQVDAGIGTIHADTGLTGLFTVAEETIRT